MSASLEPPDSLDPTVLHAAIVRVLTQSPGATARQVLAALPEDLKRRAARRDVNSVLYKGAGKEFIRSDDEKPRWRLRSAASSVDTVVAPTKRRTSARPPAAHTPVEPAASEHPSESPDVGDIARLLFEPEAQSSARKKP